MARASSLSSVQSNAKNTSASGFSASAASSVIAAKISSSVGVGRRRAWARAAAAAAVRGGGGGAGGGGSGRRRLGRRDSGLTGDSAQRRTTAPGRRHIRICESSANLSSLVRRAICNTNRSRRIDSTGAYRPFLTLSTIVSALWIDFSKPRRGPNATISGFTGFRRFVAPLLAGGRARPVAIRVILDCGCGTGHNLLCCASTAERDRHRPDLERPQLRATPGRATRSRRPRLRACPFQTPIRPRHLVRRALRARRCGGSGSAR